MSSKNNDTITIEQIKEMIFNLKSDTNFQKLERFYNSKSYLEILGISRREESHSAFIGWLLDNNANHQLGFFPIKRLLQVLLMYDKMDYIKTQDTELFESILIRKLQDF